MEPLRAHSGSGRPLFQKVGGPGGYLLDEKKVKVLDPRIEEDFAHLARLVGSLSFRALNCRRGSAVVLS